MKKLLLILIFLIFIYNVSASCEDNQVNINTASAEKLDEIVYIGPARIEQIIALRPFDFIDDLIRVSGIGDIYLSAIKEQGLACVNNVIEEGEEDNEGDNKEVNEEPQETGPLLKETENRELQTIILNPQIIKSEENKKETSKDYAFYGFIVFCVLIGILFITKNKKYKNEFR